MPQLVLRRIAVAATLIATSLAGYVLAPAIAAAPDKCRGNSPNKPCTDPGTSTGTTQSTTTSTSSSSTTSATTTSSTSPTTTTTSTTTTTTTTTTTPAPTAGAAPVAPPASYALPAGAVRVTSSAELLAALSNSSQVDIVLADGVYAASGPFHNLHDDRLYAEHLAGAVLTSGVESGGNYGFTGAVYRGLVFKVTAVANASYGAEIHTWGPAGVGTTVLDCTFYGNKVIPVGLDAYQPSGLVAQRNQFFDFTDEGLRASNDVKVTYGATTPHITKITDIYVNGVSRPVPGASNGTAEAGLWIGHPVDNPVDRIKIRNVSISGIESVNDSWNTTFSNLDVDMGGLYQSSGVCVYAEHWNYSNVFSSFSLTGCHYGFMFEWNYGIAGTGSSNNAITNGTISSYGSTVPGRQVGVYCDQGTSSTTVSGVTFKNQNGAAIDTYLTGGVNVFQGNDYSGLAAGAVTVATGHL
jgi:hypothetical protein